MKTRLALAAVTATALAGSFTVAASASPVSHSSHPVVFHKKDSGQTVTIKRGATFKVRLKACGDCGQAWSFSHRPAVSVVKVTHKTIKSQAKPPAVGGDNHTTWTFEAVGKGKTTMRMVKRSAEDGNKVIKHFTLRAKVS